MAASDNFRLVNTSENAIPKYIPGMAADIKGLREELDKKFEVGVQIDATTRDLIAQAPAGTMGKPELDKIAMETTQKLDEIAKKGDYEHYTRPLMSLGRNVHRKLGAIANDAKQEATYYDEIDKYKGWTESQKNDMKAKALAGSKPLQFDEMGRKVGGFKSGENWGDLPDPDEATREVLSMLGPDKYGVTEDIGTLYEKYKNGSIYETIGVDKIRQAFDSAAKTPGTKLFQYLDKQSRLQTFANTNGVDDKAAYDFFQNKFVPTGVNEDEIASEQLLKDKVLKGEITPTNALQQLTTKDVYNTLYGDIFNYAATKQISSITKEIKTEPSPYQLATLAEVFEKKKEERAKAAKAEENNALPALVGNVALLSAPFESLSDMQSKGIEPLEKELEMSNYQLKIANNILSNPTKYSKEQVEKAKADVEKYSGAVAAAQNELSYYKTFLQSSLDPVAKKAYGEDYRTIQGKARQEYEKSLPKLTYAPGVKEAILNSLVNGRELEPIVENAPTSVLGQLFTSGGTWVGFKVKANGKDYVVTKAKNPELFNWLESEGQIYSTGRGLNYRDKLNSLHFGETPGAKESFKNMKMTTPTAALDDVTPNHKKFKSAILSSPGNFAYLNNIGGAQEGNLLDLMKDEGLTINDKEVNIIPGRNLTQLNLYDAKTKEFNRTVYIKVPNMQKMLPYLMSNADDITGVIDLQKTAQRGDVGSELPFIAGKRITTNRNGEPLMITLNGKPTKIVVNIHKDGNTFSVHKEDGTIIPNGVTKKLNSSKTDWETFLNYTNN